MTSAFNNLTILNYKNFVCIADAGDSFTGAFTAAILAGKPVEEAHKLAVEVSAFVCTQSGAMPVLPEDLKKQL